MLFEFSAHAPYTGTHTPSARQNSCRKGNTDTAVWRYETINIIFVIAFFTTSPYTSSRSKPYWQLRNKTRVKVTGASRSAPCNSVALIWPFLVSLPKERAFFKRNNLLGVNLRQTIKVLNALQCYVAN